jgi:signal transduction histidine kinase
MKRPFSTEYRISGADGRQSWVQQTGQCLYDREGKPKHLDGVMLDITERKVAEEQSRLLHETLDVIFNTTPVIMLLINRDLRIERINRAGATFAGFDTDELGGLLFGDALSCASLFQTEGTCGTTDKCPECPICAMIDRTFSTGRPLVEAECRLVLVRRRLPVEFHFLVSTAPVMVEKKPMVLLTATDITERKKLEESRLDMERRQHDTRRLESLVTVAGGVAHDFNNILTGVYGNMEMALSKLSEDSPARPFVAESLQSSRRAMSLANQMLMYTGQGFSRSQTVDLNQIVRKHLGPFANKHSGNFRVNMRLHDSAVNIFADPDQIRQVLLNLVNNSLEACAESPEGGCAVTVTTGIEECTPSYLSGSRIYEKPQEGAFGFLDISDTGCGMQAEILPRIFEPFFSTKFLGRGLGMPAVYGIVKSHHGALFVTSEPGKGTTVRILLPLKEAAGSGEGQIPEPEHSMQTPEP